MSVITTEFLFDFGCVERSTAASGCSGRLAIDLALLRGRRAWGLTHVLGWPVVCWYVHWERLGQQMHGGAPAT